MRSRVKRMVAAPDPDPPRPENFDSVTFLPEVPSRGGGARALWYGYAAAAHLVLEMAVNLGAEKSSHAWASTEMLRRLTAGERGRPLRWALYDVGFTTPPGFALLDWRLFSGDIACRFVQGRRARLTLRQVYPAETALARRPMAQWLGSRPFKQHRRYRPVSPPAAWTADTRAGPLNGLRRRGFKQLASPLGRVSRRYSVAAAVTDPRLDRLLLAELDSRDDRGDAPLREAFRGMNWSRHEPLGE